VINPSKRRTKSHYGLQHSCGIGGWLGKIPFLPHKLEISMTDYEDAQHCSEQSDIYRRAHLEYLDNHTDTVHSDSLLLYHLERERTIINITN
jgi:hypothetical protein